MRVVVDTNVLISAQISTQGASRRLLNRLIADHDVILSDVILGEVAETLLTKFSYDSALVSNVIAELMKVVEIVEPVTFPEQICRDSDGDAILGTAVAGNADCIVTGDSDLLVLERFRDVDIISPSEFAGYEVQRS
jgi:putative PIN family toxin of toxin-antitoxin system